MSRPTWNIDHGPLRGFYRDRENGWIFGVCAGIADRFNLNLVTVRVIAIICLLLFFWVTVAVYLGATILIREKPLIYSGRDSEYDFWRHRHDRWRHS
ncbi:MAG: PspC domain-containing protein [Woeseiaceae bacterium]|nr:PspC domain-containing protein [Woeseiaceae bacterium]